ncbi:MAG: GNAT family N-acetyltransferase [Planctomycetaceae bacterium]|nr:GNAT family N-acetyltransferase [Planctomycetaceae bacterium]
MSIHVFPATGSNKRRALEVLFYDLLPDEQTEQIDTVLEAENRGELDLEGLYLAEEEEREVGACLTLTQKDRSAFIWPPVVLNPANWERVGSALLQEIHQVQQAQGILYAQAMLEPEALDQQSLLKKNQFESLARLYFMECPLETAPTDTPLLRSGASCRSMSLAELGEEQAFHGIIERTYEDTLDVPQFNLMRTGAESLESHRGNGPFDPALWFLYYVDEEPAGLILLRDYVTDDKWEIAYMGVIPDYRGTGLGMYMLQEAINRAREIGRAAIFLAVDSRNHYALEIYKRVGFSQTSIKQVLIRK